MMGLVFFGFSGVFYPIIGTRHRTKIGSCALYCWCPCTCSKYLEQQLEICEVIEEHMSFVLCVKNHAGKSLPLAPKDGAKLQMTQDANRLQNSEQRVQVYRTNPTADWTL